MKNIFKQIILDFQRKKFDDIKQRNLKIDLNIWKIISIIWPRRSWKSYYLYLIIKWLLKNWLNIENIIFVNFEDERINIKWEDLQLLIDSYLEIYPDKDLSQCFFFFDEIQNIENWEKFVRRIYDNWIKNIFITWSNSKLLSKEISTSLRWRSISYELLPLWFDEYLNFKWENLNFYATKDKAKLLKLQRDFISRWGFPEIIKYKEDLKIKVLQEYFDVMLYNDIIERYKIKNVVVLKQFVKQLIQSTTSEYSINKIWNKLKSLWLKFNKNDLYNFLEYFETVYFLKTLSKFDYSLIKQTKKKLYLFDNWFLNALTFKFSDDWGKLLENVVFIELYKKYWWDNIFFLSNWNETDFIISWKEKNIFQVCYVLNDENKQREIKWCLSWMKKFWINNSTIITFEQEDQIMIDSKKINIIPFYKRVL